MSGGGGLFGKYSHALAFTGVMAVTMPPFYLNGLGLRYYRQYLAAHDADMEKPLSPHLLNIFNRVLSRVDLPLKKANVRYDRREMIDRVQLFATKKLDPVSAGSIHLTTNAIIGLPLHFNYRALADIDLDLLQTPYTPHIDWDSFSGERFCHAIVLSDAAKAFVMARELMMCQTHHVIGGMIMKSFFAFGTYVSWFYLDRGLMLQRRLKTFGRLGFFGLVAGFGYAMYTSVADLYQCWHEKGADRAAAKLGYAYAQGGVEFYTKTLDRNKALRKLLEHQGERLFTLHGNETSYIRRRHVQLTERRTALEGYCKWYDDNLAKKEDAAGA